MRGVPLRIEIGNREVQDNTAIIFRRDLRSRNTIPLDKFVKAVKQAGKAITKELWRRAKERFDNSFKNADTFDEICDIINQNKAARISFCTLEMKGLACAEKIKDVTGADIRGVKLGENEKPWGLCPMCGEPATVVAYVGKQY